VGDLWSFDAAPNNAGFAPALLNDVAYGLGGSTLDFTIGGLTDGGNYNLFFYTENGGYASGAGTYTIGLTSHTASNTAASQTGFVLGDNYVEFTNVTANGSGNISGTDTGYLDGLQVVSAPIGAPEPTSMALIGLGALALLVTRRRLAIK
jgi:hypothetical protein